MKTCHTAGRRYIYILVLSLLHVINCVIKCTCLLSVCSELAELLTYFVGFFGVFFYHYSDFLMTRHENKLNNKFDSNI